MWVRIEGGEEESEQKGAREKDGLTGALSLIRPTRNAKRGGLPSSQQQAAHPPPPHECGPLAGSDQAWTVRYGMAWGCETKDCYCWSEGNRKSAFGVFGDFCLIIFAPRTRIPLSVPFPSLRISTSHTRAPTTARPPIPTPVRGRKRGSVGPAPSSIHVGALFCMAQTSSSPLANGSESWPSS